MSRRGGGGRSGAAALGGPIRMSAPAVRPAPPPAMPAIRVANPSPRVSPAGTSINASANNEGYSLSARQTFGGVNKNVFVEGQVNGAWNGQPSFGAAVGMSHGASCRRSHFSVPCVGCCSKSISKKIKLTTMLCRWSITLLNCQRYQ